MTNQQTDTIGRLQALGYVLEYSRHENNGIVRVNVVRRLRRGVLSLLIRPDGTYRDSRYVRWNNQLTKAA